MGPQEATRAAREAARPGRSRRLPRLSETPGPPEHPLVTCAERTSAFCQLHDPAAAELPAAELLRAATVFALNAFGYLAGCSLDTYGCSLDT